MRSTPRTGTVDRRIVRTAPVAFECGHFPDPAFHAFQDVGDKITCVPCSRAAKEGAVVELLPESCDDCGALLDRWNTCSAGCRHYCVACGEPCFRCPSGWVCKNSHGNASPRVVRAAKPEEPEDVIRPCPFCKSHDTTTLEVSLQKGLRRMACRACKQEWVWSDGTKASLEDAVAQKECGGCGRRWVEKDGKIVEVLAGARQPAGPSPVEVAHREGFDYGVKAGETGALFGSEALRKFADAMALRCCTLEKSASNVKAWADGYVEGYGEPSSLCAPEDAFGVPEPQCPVPDYSFEPMLRIKKQRDRILDLIYEEKEDLEMTQLPTTPLGQPDPFVASVESAIISAEERTGAQTQLDAVHGYLTAYRSAFVNTPETFEWAAAQTKWIKSLCNDVEARRTFFTKPLLEIKRRVDAVFMPTIKALEACEQELKGKMAGFDRAQREQQRAAMQASTQVFAQGGTPTEPIPEVVRAQGVSIKHTWIPRIVDESLVPREFCSPDLAKITKAIWYANTASTPPRPIPGVEFALDSSTTVRR